MLQLKLYSAAECALCDEALAIIYATQAHGSYHLEKVDINAAPDTQKRYALRIPVLADALTGKELGWPFDENDISLFVEEIENSNDGDRDKN